MIETSEYFMNGTKKYLLNLLANSKSWFEIPEDLRARGWFCTTEPLLLKNSFLLMEAVDLLKVSVTVVEDRRKNLEDPEIWNNFST